MRVLFSVSGWPGHYFPMLPLARHALATGHRVRVLCAPSQAGAVTAAGLVAVPVLDGLDMVLQSRLSHYWQARAGNWPYPWLPAHPVTGRQMEHLDEFDFPAYRTAHRADTLATTARSFDAAVSFAREWRPDIVVHDRLSLDGLLAARVLDIPAVAHLWGPVGTHEQGALRLVPGDSTKSFPRYGVGDLGEAPFRYVIDPCPDDLRPPVGDATRVLSRYVPYAGMFDGVPPAPDGTGRPRVCVVWGTSLTAMVGPRSFVVPDILAALAAQDVDVVALMNARDAAALRPPDGVRVVSDVALAGALDGASVVVHHGGAGCVMTALAAGVPQVAVTFAGEQAANAERVAATGAGVHLAGVAFDPDTIGRVVSTVADDPMYAAAARRLRIQNGSRPDLAAVCERLAELAGARAFVPG